MKETINCDGLRDSPSSWDKLSAEERAQRALIGSMAALNVRAKKYLCINKNGEKFNVLGIGIFCKKHGLEKYKMIRVAEGHIREYKGWVCYFTDDNYSPNYPEPVIKKKPGPKKKEVEK